MSKKYELTVLEEGYENNMFEEFEKEKEKIKEAEEIKDTSLNILTKRNALILLIWGLLYKLFIKWDFGMIYFFISILVFIFNNLGERKPWQLSAYSIFNPNFERLPGTMTVNDLQSTMGMGGSRRTEEDEEDSITSISTVGTNRIEDHLNMKITYSKKSEVRKREMKEKAEQPLNSFCNCGSKKKYKNCCIKKNL